MICGVQLSWAPKVDPKMAFLTGIVLGLLLCTSPKLYPPRNHRVLAVKSPLVSRDSC
jgi:hypothetical protein